jgi:hypothetical protein
MLLTSDFRTLILASSVGNNRWLFFSSYSLYVFLLFFFIYCFSLFTVFLYLNNSSLYFSFSSYRKTLGFVLSLISLSGFPPFPLFFLKLTIVYFIASYLPSFYVFIFLVFSCFLLAGYFRFLFSFILFSFSFYTC